MGVDECAHCEHYGWVSGQLFDQAIDLDAAEGKVYKLQGRLHTAVEALVWCLARIDDPPAWVRCAIDEVEAPL